MEILWFFIRLALGGIIVRLVFNARTASTRIALETKLKATEEAQQKTFVPQVLRDVMPGSGLNSVKVHPNLDKHTG